MERTGQMQDPNFGESELGDFLQGVRGEANEQTHLYHHQMTWCQGPVARKGYQQGLSQSMPPPSGSFHLHQNQNIGQRRWHN